MAAHNYGVVGAWLAGESAQNGGRGNFWTNGDRIYTYGVELAHKDAATGAPVLSVPEDWRYSATSGIHFAAVKMGIANPEFVKRTTFNSDFEHMRGGAVRPLRHYHAGRMTRGGFNSSGYGRS